jgi:plasmid stability protein
MGSASRKRATRAVHVRNLDLDTVDALKRRAVSNQRSLEGELRDILRVAAQEQNADPPGGRHRLNLRTVHVGNRGHSSRSEIYGDEER